jgi:hypothetical protein
MAIIRQASNASLSEVAADYFQRALTDELGNIRPQMGKHSRSVNGRSVWDTLRDNIP